MELEFVKMEGTGNDFIFCEAQALPAGADPAQLAQRLCRRRTGVGADGLVLVSAGADGADAGMRIINADGSEAEFCGNALRCVGKYLFDAGRRAAQYTVRTGAGPRTVRLVMEGAAVAGATVQAGIPAFLPPAPLPQPLAEAAAQALPTAGEAIPTRLVLGNPHCVLFVREDRQEPLLALGPLFARHPFFPGGVNLELVHPVSRRMLQLRVWERGVGETLACGSGAAAAAAAAVRAGICPAGADILVSMPGGRVVCRQEAGGILLTGPARTVYRGKLAL